jgi:oxygen-independent coproporphyrinogen-3 oxidase
MAGIYLHIPFCKQACHYCDFHFSTNQQSKTQLVHWMVREMELQKNYLEGEKLATIYFGGGTPSVLDQHELQLLLLAVKNNFPVAYNPEVTLEANPDDLTDEKIIALKRSGINRLSIGIQSFDDDVLKFLNRPHSSSDAIASIQRARSHGFTNISIDLIYAIPGQSEEQWKKNVGQALWLNPEHISAYSLTIEKKTVFGNWYEKGKLNLISDDASASQLEILTDALTAGGYEHYEISNFSRPGFHSRHNSNYWKGEKYLGVGPAAHSYNLESRQYNLSNNHLYMKALERNIVPFEKELLSKEDHVNEYVLTSLRTSTGLDLTNILKNYEINLYDLNRNYVDNLIVNDLAVLEKGFLKLTRKGRLLADKISSDLFLTTT